VDPLFFALFAVLIRRSRPVVCSDKQGMSKLQQPVPTRPRLTLAWPAPAVLSWVAAWLVYRAMEPNLMALVAALVPPACAAWQTQGFMRRALLLTGFPLSLMLLDVSLWPAWLWLLPAAVLLLLYPVKAWRDAPLFPTGVDALETLAERISLPVGGQVLDAGCGVGHGLQALRTQWPLARLNGIEHSWPLVVLARLRCPQSVVHRGDMWAYSWARYDLVYLFQRPESMERAWAKACKEMRPGAWLVSLEFPVPNTGAECSLERDGQRPVWVYRVPGLPTPAAQSSQAQADKPVDMPASCAVC
jgi:SAM-dependent methyltransferase